MNSATTFPISFDRPSHIPMTVLGAGPKVSRVKVSASTVDIRMGWAFQATIPREDVVSAQPLNREELRGPFRLSVLRGVNYWRGTALVNGAGTGLVEITLDRPKWVHLGPAPGPNAAAHRERRGPVRARYGTQPKHRTLARFG